LDTLIKNAFVLTMDEAGRTFENGCVAVSGGKIVHVGAESDLPKGFSARKTVDAKGGVVMPGFINAHTHLAMTLLRGLGGGLKLQDWLETKIWPAEGKLRAGHCYWGSMLGLVEMIRSGTTAFLDMYFFMEETARAVEETGLRAVLSRGITGRSPGFKKALAENEALYRDFNGEAGGRISVMLGPHAEYTCDERSIREIVELAHKLGCGMHVHLQETSAETDGCRARYGMSPAEWFRKMGLFERHTVAAHCVTLSNEDISILRQYGVSAAHCPGSNMKLASGIAPIKALLGAGVIVSLGTDGAASNDNLDMLEEIRLAALCAKIREGDPTALGALDALKLATACGARALEIDTVAGSIEVGKDADIIVISTNSPSWHPTTDIASNLVYSAGSQDVSMTMVKGRILMENFEIKGLDVEKIFHEADKISAAVCS
jgi:5-methylthioadenosine/S-adenosylhomocysteine deaminase